MAESNGLLNRRRRDLTAGSNPALSAIFLPFFRRCKKITAKIVKLKAASKLALEFYHFYIVLSACRRKRDFLTPHGKKAKKWRRGRDSNPR